MITELQKLKQLDILNYAGQINILLRSGTLHRGQCFQSCKEYFYFLEGQEAFILDRSCSLPAVVNQLWREGVKVITWKE
jgi:hypothetical protein